MGTILPFLKEPSVFDPEATIAMSTAFDAVCASLQISPGDARGRETVATRIVELARRGERDAIRLRDRVLHEAGAR
jgi:hypothetical protein